MSKNCYLITWKKEKQLKCVTATWKSCSDINSRGGGRLGIMWRCFRCKTEKVGLFWLECQGLILRDIFSFPSVRGMMLEYKTAGRKLGGPCGSRQDWPKKQDSAKNLKMSDLLYPPGSARRKRRCRHVTPPEATEETWGGKARAAARTPPTGSIGVCSRAGWFYSI